MPDGAPADGPRPEDPVPVPRSRARLDDPFGNLKQRNSRPENVGASVYGARTNHTRVVRMRWQRRPLRIVCLLAPLLFEFVYAQVGVKAGISLSGLLSSNPDDFRPFLGHEVEWIQYGESKSVIGIQIGLFYSIKISEYFDLQPEVSYVQRGYWFDQTPSYDARYVVSIDYLALPVTIRYKLPIDVFPMGLFTGPYVAIKLNANGRIEYEGKEEVKSLASVKAFDYGLVTGLGSHLDIGAGQMIVDLQFYWGLHNMMSQPSNYVDLYEDPGTVRNLAFALVMGYRFDGTIRR